MNNSNNPSSNLSALNPNLLETFKGTSNELTRALVNTNILTQEQMHHAVEVFRLSTIDDQVIFWQIDRENNILEGKVMYYQADAHRSHSRNPVTISWLLKRHKQLPEDWEAKHCLFGLHQVPLNSPEGEDTIIAIVESEKTAIICTELIPELSDSRVIWLATGGKSNLTFPALQPVLGHRVILFPDTDTTGETYSEWLNVASQANNSLPKQGGVGRVFITVSNILELHATDEQKKRKIDIADFIIEKT